MITGSIVALVTPMHPDDSIDWESLKGLLDWHIAAGTAAIAAVGTTGESATLDVGEHLDVIKFCVEHLAGRLPVIAGTGANSTREAIHLTRNAANLGVEACLLVTPYYNRPSQRGLFEHYRAVAEAVNVPQVLYNVPSRTAVDLADETALALAKLPNIVGIKDATGDMARAKALISGSGTDFAVYSGDDATACDLMLMGGQGSISVTANVAPETVAKICAAAMASEESTARELDASVAGLNSALFVEANPMPVKYALHAMGRIEAGIRLPLVMPEGDAASVVEAALEAAPK